MIETVHNLSRGQVPQSTQDFIEQIEAKNMDKSGDALHLFALNYDVDLHNSEKFLEMEGNFLMCISVNLNYNVRKTNIY